MTERQADPLSARSRSQPRGRSGPDPLEQGLDRLVSAGRQLVDGVAGTRPGSRGGGRGGGERGGERPRLAGLGRWVEEKLDWILEDEDDWREPWQQQQDSTRAAAQPPVRSPRRPLEAISRRGGAPAAEAEVAWPDDDSFSLSRWQRPSQAAGRQEPPPLAPAARPLPRSSRRRQP